MTSITKLKTSQTIQFFEPSVALSLVLAFHRQLDLDALLSRFHSQARALLQVTGCRYRNDKAGIDVMLDSDGRHTASYNLTYQEDHLGELIMHFDRRVNEEVLKTAEDLITLVAAARTQLISGLRDSDSVYQIDDDTLAVLLPATSPEQALECAKKLRVLIASLHLKDHTISQQLTACTGVAGARRSKDAEAVLDRARKALSLALREGPNTLRQESAQASSL